VLPLFADLPPYRSPGLSFHYSNAGYVLLALLIEEVTGVAYVDVVAERVLGPAGMTESGFFALDEVRPRMSTGYLPPEAPGGMWRATSSRCRRWGPDGGLFASAGDLTRFLTAYDDSTLMPAAAHGHGLSRRGPRVGTEREVPGPAERDGEADQRWVGHRVQREAQGGAVR